jgi:hypothetical protein
MRKRADDVVGSGLDKPEPESLGKRIVASIRALVKEASMPPAPELKPLKHRQRPRSKR